MRVKDERDKIFDGGETYLQTLFSSESKCQNDNKIDNCQTMSSCQIKIDQEDENWDEPCLQQLYVNFWDNNQVIKNKVDNCIKRNNISKRTRKMCTIRLDESQA